MFKQELVRNNLWVVYQDLPALEQSLIHLCAVIYEPTTAPVVYSCFRKTCLATRYPLIVSLKDISLLLQHLQELHLLTDRFPCHSDFMEIAIRQAAQTSGFDIFSGPGRCGS